MISSFLLLNACSEENHRDYFPSKEEALENLIQSEGITGSVDLITTLSGDELLVIEQEEHHYFAGELLEDKKGYTAGRISASVVMELGGSFELKTASRHTYTIFFEKQQENQNFFPLSNEDYYIALAEGNMIEKDDSVYTNAIKEVNMVKE